MLCTGLAAAAQCGALVLSLLIVPGLPTTQRPTWVGKLILVKRPGLKIYHLDDGGKQTAVATLNGIDYRVRQEQQGWIKVITPQGIEGWLDKSEAVLLEDAPAYFTSRLAEDPKDAVAYNFRANAWRMQGKLDQAIKDFGELIRLDPKAYAYNNRGIVWGQKKEYDRALQDFSQAIRLLPTYAMAHNNRGNVWRSKNDLERALQDFNQAIQLDPKFVAAYNSRGLVWRAKKDLDRALQDFSEAVRLDPKSVTVLLNRGLTFVAKKDYARAVHDYQQALRLDPAHVAVCNSYAWLLATCPDSKVRDGAKAVELAKVAVDLTGGKNASYCDTLAAAYAEVGRFDEAVRWQLRALEDAAFAQDAVRQRLEMYRAKKPYRE